MTDSTRYTVDSLCNMICHNIVEYLKSISVFECDFRLFLQLLFRIKIAVTNNKNKDTSYIFMDVLYV